MKKRPAELAQLVVTVLIFLSFTIGVFFVESYVSAYLLVPLIITNIILIIINKTKGVLTNLILLIIVPFLFIFIIGYIASIIGAVISFFYALGAIVNYIRQQDAKKSRKI